MRPGARRSCSRGLFAVVAAGVLTVLPLVADAGENDIACATTDKIGEKAICAWERYRAANVQVIRLINRALFSIDAYESAMDPDAPGSARAMLVDGHQAWQTYREETCNLEARLYFGAPGASLAYARCLARLTEHRLEDLRVVLEEEAG